MRKRVVRISPVQAGKVLAVLYALLSIPFAIVMIVVSSQHSGAGWFSVFLALAIPVIYLALGFVVTIIGAWLYNVVAGWTGGIEFEIREQPEA